MIDIGRQLVLEALTQPRHAARRLLGLGLSQAFVIQVILIVAALTAIIQYLYGMILTTLPGMEEAVLTAPLQMAIFQVVQVFVTAIIVVAVGRLFKGNGGFQDALTLMAFLGVMSLLWMFLTVVLSLLFLPLLMLVILITAFWTIWAFGSFVAELHGFSSVPAVIGITFATAFVVALLLVLVLGPNLTMLGIELPEGMMDPNVQR